MITSNQKTSLLVPYQLPEFIRGNGDYKNFVAFVQAYYEWMEQSGNVTDGTKNLTSYFDIDNTTDEFINYFINDFLPYFPEDALSSKNEAVKFAKQLYQSKGTPASYQFLFRVLYDSDFDYLNTGDVTFKASDGNWFVPKSLNLATSDPRFLQLNTNGFGSYRVFGETSKSFGTIEYVTLAGNKTEIFISDIERLFESGETIKIVDGNNQDVIINGSNLTAKLVGQISTINVNPNSRGLYYSPGDPVVAYNGLNSTITNPVGASAIVGTVTSGQIQSVSTLNGGYGYTLANTIINFSNLNSGAKTPIAQVGSVSSADATKVANATFIPTDTIALKATHYIGNIAGSSGANTKNLSTGLYTQGPYQFANNLTANANTSLANAFTFLTFTTYPISSVIVQNGGGGLTTAPTITAQSSFQTDVTGQYGQLSNLGILAPIQIINGGSGYVANDKINFIGGSGYGSYANVATVNATGAITSVSYVYKPGENPKHYPLGGMGYTITDLPTLTITSANNQAANAVLQVNGILGSGATFGTSVDRAGSVTTINVTDPGQDYVSSPSISLKVQDILVSNVYTFSLPTTSSNLVVYQGSTLSTATYIANFNSITQLQFNNDSTQAIWNMRVFNYNSQPDPTKPFNFSGGSTSINANAYTLKNVSYAANAFKNSYFTNGSPAYTNGVKNYGDGTALASAKFLNGLNIGSGQYIDAKGQPSGFSVLQNLEYNNFTYLITVNKEIQKYRDILLNLLHPSGTNLVGRYAVRSNSNFSFTAQEVINKGFTLYHYTSAYASNVTMATSLTNPSTNILTFNNLSGANLGNIIFANSSTIGLSSTNGINVSSLITSVNYTNNTATIAANTFLSYANVAYVSAIVGTPTINIQSITNSYNIVNNGVYSNAAYPLQDIVYSGDTVQIGLNTYTVQSVNAVSGIITTTTNIVSNVSNTLLSVNRTFVAGGTSSNVNGIIIFNTVGTQYIPQITDESGNLLITEGGDYILLG